MISHSGVRADLFSGKKRCLSFVIVVHRGNSIVQTQGRRSTLAIEKRVERKKENATVQTKRTT